MARTSKMLCSRQYFHASAARPALEEEHLRRLGDQEVGERSLEVMGPATMRVWW